MKSSRSLGPAPVGLVLLVATLGRAGAIAEPPGTATSPSPVSTAISAPAAPADVTGTVLETLDAGTYSYLRIRTSDGETWAAVPKTPVGVGEMVTVAAPMPMDGFESRSLKRKFDRLWFGTLRTATGAPMSKEDHRAMSGSDHHGAPVPAAGEKITVTKAEGTSARTVAEVYAQRKELAGSSVTLRAKVTKVSRGILNRNWLHLRDGSGTGSKGDHDLTVTTNDVAESGDIVLVTGKVASDRDFGSGYSYTVIVEDAKVTKEK